MMYQIMNKVVASLTNALHHDFMHEQELIKEGSYKHFATYDFSCAIF